MTAILMTHVGIAVRDLEASKRFYADTFGFEETYRRDIGPAFAPLLGLSEVAGEIAMLRLGDKLIELIGHDPRPEGTAEKAMNALGFTHMAFNVPDVQEVGKRLEANGGRVNWDTKLDLQVGDEDREYLFCRDPDGNHIELIRGTPLG
jgi:catechol 2,3-dioxygenase-like lactoylglutathione lyase family enzyme